MNRIARLLVPFAAAAMLGGCGIKESFEKADAVIARFHGDLDAANYTRIWTRADPELRSASDKAAFEKLLGAVHTKLGAVKETKQVGWNTNASTSGTYLTATYQTTFEKGTGTERFTYRKGDEDAVTLVNYAIDSQDMMLN
ncbi:DUF4019 domain-containing protein [Novosphingobium mangrovi (ex Hu et al. 2023)]|uniref:DUF4019 domain-containing protein n=1 Tax=Novosphingobium mangrovi (ex Hu et al. 2023) TaxID=2930094 RepID=A0ABT0A8L5_9SPHN|nr:DUF4019 domain-containing protein [Novosphingobium mangrovi (ex Hu et al. 2023)]MCJ1959539.1 DUF4019 domain-containing protein [Novosphingobium mangrovi (ex Hu et al. 2023)]